VSVVIPVHDHLDVTMACLAALLSSRGDAAFEVIVVDDASTDEVRRLPDMVEGVTVIRNDTNRGFVHSCNRGAEHARGDFITFLNNDTIPAPGWLDEMLRVFDDFARAGLVGSKLLSPDGSLQEAGGIIWSSGEASNHGRGQDADRPEFGYTRQADYLSGAAITIGRETWWRAGGFSVEFAPGYYEDVDLAFKVRALGLLAIYAPKSVVIHAEGTSGGTDTTQGMKRYQDANLPLFRAKWARAISGQPARGTAPRLAADHQGVRGRALFVGEGVPRPSRSDGLRSIREMRLLQSFGYKVMYVPEAATRRDPDVESLERMGIEMATAPYASGPGSVLGRPGTDVDIAYLAGSATASRVLPIVRRLTPRTTVLARLANADPLGEPDDRAASRLQPILDQADVVLTELDVDSLDPTSRQRPRAAVSRAPAASSSDAAAFERDQELLRVALAMAGHEAAPWAKALVARPWEPGSTA
jgi:GT2 family glycosyltransferase